MKGVLGVVAAAFIVTACAGADAASPAPAGAPASATFPVAAGEHRFSPPPLAVISDDGATLQIDAFAYCWSGPSVSLCADGDPSLYAAPTLQGERWFSFSWPLDGWTWTVETRAAADRCDVVLPRLTNQQAGASIPVPAGDLIVVAGRGPEGDAAFVFDPAFAATAGLPGMSATVIWADADTQPLTAHGLSLLVANVAEKPAEFAASAFIEDAEGRVAEFDLEPEPPGECWSGNLVAALPPGTPQADLLGFVPPLTVSIDLVLDATALRSAEVAWPQDFPTLQGPNLMLEEIGR